MPNFDRHECCGCYERKVPIDLRSILDWKEKYEKAVLGLRNRQVTPEEFAFWALKGCPCPTNAQPYAPGQGEINGNRK